MTKQEFTKQFLADQAKRKKEKDRLANEYWCVRSKHQNGVNHRRGLNKKSTARVN